jgi:anti-sigma B factor antagonist
MSGSFDSATHDSEPDTDRVMALSTSSDGSTAVVSVVGEVDLITSSELMAELDRLRAQPAVDLVVIDLSEVEFLGSSGLGVLANIATRVAAHRVPAQRGGSGGSGTVPVRLVAPPTHRPVVRPWEMMSLHQIVPLYPDVAAAKAASE